MELSPENQGANNLKLIIFSSEGKTPLFSDFFYLSECIREFWTRI